jgi:hypothetical protein
MVVMCKPRIRPRIPLLVFKGDAQERYFAHFRNYHYIPLQLRGVQDASVPWKQP